MADISKELLEDLKNNEYDLHRKVIRWTPQKNPSAFNITLDRIAEVREFRSGWDLEKDPIELMIVGVGGTGGYLVRDLCRFLYSLEKRIQTPLDIQLTLFDGDIVEDKNILRQNFMPQDVGSNKAEVMATRHTRAFGSNVSYIPEMFSAHNAPVTNRRRIIIGCVDNNTARREFAKFVSRAWDEYAGLKKDIYWIDAGNEKKTGQVIVGSRELQDVTDLYPEILGKSNDTTEQVSCAERMLQDEQNMFVNLTAANLILNYVKNIILDIPMVTHGTVFNIDNKFDNYYVLKKPNQ